MGQDINPNSCISNNPKLGDSAYWANNSIKLFEQKKYEDAIESTQSHPHIFFVQRA